MTRTFNLIPSLTLVNSVMLDLEEKGQPSHHHNLMSEVRNNGWIMPRTLETGEICKWLELTWEFLTTLTFSSIPILKLFPRVLHQMALLYQEREDPPFQAQHHSSEERSNGWIMQVMLANLEPMQKIPPTQEFLTTLLLCKLLMMIKLLSMRMVSI